MAAYSVPAWQNGNQPAIDADALTAMGKAIEIAEHPYGVCSTSSSTAAKVVSVNAPLDSLFTGLTIRVKFSNKNTADNPTLNVNSLGAHPICSLGSTPFETWQNGQILTLTYDGSTTNWLLANTRGISVESGTYTGTGGAYGVNNPTQIYLKNKPLLFFIRGYSSGGTTSRATFFGLQSSFTPYSISSGSNATVYARYGASPTPNIEIYSTHSAVVQFNGSGMTYEWLAIC